MGFGSLSGGIVAQCVRCAAKRCVGPTDMYKASRCRCCGTLLVSLA